MDQFQQKFVEEALDNVEKLEENLFELESNMENYDPELIQSIFRSMHTIKGSGMMFGFDDLSRFTHNFETIYDLVRNDKLKVTKDIVDLSFESLDYIRKLLDIGEGKLTDPDDIAQLNDFIGRITKHFPEGTTLTKGRAEREAEEKAKKEAEAAKAGPKNYLVTIEPMESLLENGTNPLYTVDDLTGLGEWKTVAFTDKVESFNQFKPLAMRINWQVLLHTEQDAVNDIQDNFIFIEDECKVDIAELPSGDYIVAGGEVLEALLKTAAESGKYLTPADFEQFKQAAPEQEPAKEEAKAEQPVQAAAQKSEKKEAGPKKEEAKIATMRVASSKIDELVNAVSEMVTMQAQLNLMAEKQGIPALSAIAEQMEKTTRALRENAFSLSLIPLGGELVRFQRLVRDLSNNLHKQLEFIVEGGEIELDKNIIEHLTDPLMHMIRNSGDHGIELPEERIAKGKDPKGTIRLKAFYSGSSVIIQLSDDGKGMDPDKIFKKAVEKGLVDPNAKLAKKEILNLIFASGFSTAEKVSDVSGRGVGMDVVKSKIAEIRGEVSIDSEIDKGTTFTLDLPLTLSIIDGLLTKVNGEQFIFPLSNIERILSPKEVQFNHSGVGNVFTYGGEQIGYIELNSMFYSMDTLMDTSKIIMVRSGEKHFGIVVDQIIGEYQIVVKPLGRFMRKVDMISGASVMGDGSLSLVVDTTRMVNYYIQQRYRKDVKEKEA
ncbi:MAG: chemotaxis protein CheA [Bacteroidales bacterium]|nr:chemotaxis protein CheA [Bacteroidales bacterium]